MDATEGEVADGDRVTIREHRPKLAVAIGGQQVAVRLAVIL